MPVEEKRSRMRLLRDIVRTYSVQNWAEAFLTAAMDAPSLTGETRQSIPLATPETREQKIA